LPSEPPGDPTPAPSPVAPVEGEAATKASAPLPSFLPVVVLLHVLFVLRFEPPAAVLGPHPIATIDYDTHYEQTLRAVEAFRSTGRTWAYDPHLLAGSISGAVFDADSKLHEMFVIALDRLHVAPHRAYNLFVWIAHALVPVVVYASARLFRLSRGAATGAAFLASMIWLFDAFSHWVFWVGMISWGFAAYLALLPVALFHAYLREKKPWQIACFAALLGLIHHLHPYAFFVLAAPLLGMYLDARRTLARRDHVAILGAAAFTVILNAWWIGTALKFWHYVLNSAFYLDATAAFALYDYLGFTKDVGTTGVIAARTAFRFFTLAAAVLGLVALRREKDDRHRVFLYALVATVGTAYLGGYIPVLRQVQPYRFLLAGCFFAVIPAALLLERALLHLRAERPAWPVRALLIVLAVSIVPRFVRDVAYFVPELVPRPGALPKPLPPDVNMGPGFGTITFPEPVQYRHNPLEEKDLELVNFVRRNDDGKGRWLVEFWMAGERLAWATSAQVLGGFRELNMAHSDANWFRRHDDGVSPDVEEFPRYLEQYNVHWVVMTNPTRDLETRGDILEPITALKSGFRIYKVRKRGTFLDGDKPGDVKAGLNRIRVRGSEGGDLLLRYHFMETLQCNAPGCTLERVPVPGDRVGFIGVKNAPADFDIVNAYR
jgi:hypothetical protein